MVGDLGVEVFVDDFGVILGLVVDGCQGVVICFIGFWIVIVEVVDV